jgi:hypothetical protein
VTAGIMSVLSIDAEHPGEQTFPVSPNDLPLC